MTAADAVRAMKVARKLVWVQRERHFWAAEVSSATIYITEYAGMENAFKLDLERASYSYYPTLELAKAAAQAHHEAAVRAAMNPEVLELLADVVEVLEWYGEQADGCRKLGNSGNPARAALDADGGKRARALLDRIAATGGVK